MRSALPDNEFADAYDSVRAMLGLGPYDPFGHATE